MSRRPAQRQFDTLKAIQDQAFELFGRYGYEGVSIGDIAAATGLSKGALYWHFRGKEALYLACLRQLHAIFDDYVFAPMKAEADPVRAVLHLFTGLHRLVQDPRIEHGIAGYWLIPSSPETQALIAAQQAFESASRAVIADALARGVAQGRLDLRGDLEEFSRAVICLVEAVVLPLRHQDATEVGRILAVLARTLFRAYARDPRAAETLAAFAAN